MLDLAGFVLEGRDGLRLSPIGRHSRQTRAIEGKHDGVVGAPAGTQIIQ